jgi:hypothetical protein
MYVLGGRVLANGDDVASVFKFDSAQGTWSEVAPMPGPKSRLLGCTIGSDIFVFEGVHVYRYDTAMDTWSKVGRIPHAYGHSATVLDGLIYIVGTFGVILCFDPVTETWDTLALTLQKKFGGTSFVVGGHLYATGSYATSGYTYDAAVELYHVASDTWVAATDMLTGRNYCCALTIECSS